jgi:hypothetical protein
MTEDEAWDELERKQAKKWDASDMAHRPNGLTVDANIINKAKWYQEGYEAGQHDKRNIKDDDDIQEYKKPWVGLTDKEIDLLSKWSEKTDKKNLKWFDHFHFAKIIEEKLKERNT